MKSMSQSPKNKRVFDTLSLQLSYGHDFPIEDVWNTDNAIARLLVPRLQTFKAFDKHGYPLNMGDMWKWNNTIQKMIDAFELMKYAHTMHDKEDNKTMNRVLTSSIGIFSIYGIKSMI